MSALPTLAQVADSSSIAQDSDQVLSVTGGAAATTDIPEPRTHDEAEAIIDAYTTLREKCYQAARRDNGALMGNDAWLRNALNANDIEMSPTAEGLHCHGSTYTTQTMESEWFDFDIPFAALDAE